MLQIDKAYPTSSFAGALCISSHRHLSPGLNASLLPLLAVENRVLPNVDALLPPNAICYHTLCSDSGKEKNSSKQLCSNNCAQRNTTEWAILSFSESFKWFYGKISLCQPILVGNKGSKGIYFLKEVELRAESELCHNIPTIYETNMLPMIIGSLL